MIQIVEKDAAASISSENTACRVLPGKCLSGESGDLRLRLNRGLTRGSGRLFRRQLRPASGRRDVGAARLPMKGLTVNAGDKQNTHSGLLEICQSFFYKARKEIEGS